MNPPLRDVQRWFDAVVRHPDGAARGVRAVRARAFVPVRDVQRGAIVSTTQRSAVTALQVYVDSYRARLAEVLGDDYPALRRFVGDGTFAAIASDYVDAHPSRHPNLNRFGRRLPAFLRERAHTSAAAVDLARLELAVVRAFDAPEFTPMQKERFHAIPAASWPRVRLELNPSVHVLRLRAEAVAEYAAWQQGADETPPAHGVVHVAVFRSGENVLRSTLGAGAARVLRALGRGAPLGEAAQAGTDVDLRTCFGEWQQHGFFTAARASGSTHTA